MTLLLRIAVRHCSKPSTFVIVWNGVGGLAGLSFQGGGGYLVAMYPPTAQREGLLLSWDTGVEDVIF